MQAHAQLTFSAKELTFVPKDGCDLFPKDQLITVKNGFWA